MANQNLQRSDLPADFLGSLPEWLVLVELDRRGLKEGLDFFYQSPLLGGRLDKGGVVIDFIFANPPNLAVNVQGVYFHYARGAAVRTVDMLARAQLAAQGITLIFIDEDDIERDVEYYVGEALRFVDHSRLGR